MCNVFICNHLEFVNWCCVSKLSTWYTFAYGQRSVKQQTKQHAVQRRKSTEECASASPCGQRGAETPETSEQALEQARQAPCRTACSMVSANITSLLLRDGSEQPRVRSRNAPVGDGEYREICLLCCVRATMALKLSS